MWELFHRAPGVTAQDGAQGGSLGLGLHISKAIVTAHGGRVGVQSRWGRARPSGSPCPSPAPGPYALARRPDPGKCPVAC